MTLCPSLVQHRPLALVRALALLLALALASACQTYVPPGEGADLSGFVPSGASEEEIQAILSRKPAAPFPATLALLRVQGASYRSASYERPYGTHRDRFSVIGVRELEDEAQLARISALPWVRGVALGNSLLNASHARDELDLRRMAAQLQADLTVIYTVNTAFRSEDEAPLLTAVSLGLIPTRVDSITSTATAVMIDTRTGYLYGTAEATERRDRRTGLAYDDGSIDQTRLAIERAAFAKLLGEFEHMGALVAERHMHREDAAPAAAVPAASSGS